MSDTEAMPRRRTQRRWKPLVDPALADELLAKAEAQGVELLGPDGLLSQVTKAVLERALGEELTAHLGYEKHDPAGRGSGNSRNGRTPKTLLDRCRCGRSGGAAGPQRQFRPEDRPEGPDPPRRVQRPDHRPLCAGDDDPRHPGAPAGDLRRRGVPGPDLAGSPTRCVEELQEWQARPLDAVYPVVFIDALMVKIRDGVVANRPVYLAIGIDCDGDKQVLGLWIGPSTGESAKFWMSVLAELKTRAWRMCASSAATG